MGSIGVSSSSSKFVLTADALNKALPGMHITTRAIHADDFVSPHRAIAPGMHTAVNFRYARDPDELVPEENKDVRNLVPRFLAGISPDKRVTAKCPVGLPRLFALYRTEFKPTGSPVAQSHGRRSHQLLHWPVCLPRVSHPTQPQTNIHR